MRFILFLLVQLSLASVSWAQLTIIDQNAVSSSRTCVVASKGAENSGYSVYCDGKHVIDLNGKFLWRRNSALHDRSKNLSEILSVLYKEGYRLGQGANNGDLANLDSVSLVK